jgi:hypothetical protein
MCIFIHCRKVFADQIYKKQRSQTYALASLKSFYQTTVYSNVKLIINILTK